MPDELRATTPCGHDGGLLGVCLLEAGHSGTHTFRLPSKPDELRARCEAFMNDGSGEIKSWTEIFMELSMPGPTYDIFMNCLVAFAQEERAAGLREAAAELTKREENCVVALRNDMTQREHAEWRANMTMLKYLAEWCAQRAREIQGDQHGNSSLNK